MKKKRGRKKIPILQRIFKRTTIPITNEGTNDIEKCWLWKGPVNNAGYGLIKHSNELNMVSVHRAIMVEYLKRIEYKDKTLVLHDCGNKLCVNPHHLKTGDLQDRVELQKRYDRFYYSEGNRNQIYKTCSHCGETTHAAWYSRKHRLCEYNAQHKYITSQIIGKKNKC